MNDFNKQLQLLRQEIKYAKTSESDSLTGIQARFNELETAIKNHGVIGDVSDRVYASKDMDNAYDKGFEDGKNRPFNER